MCKLQLHYSWNRWPAWKFGFVDFEVSHKQSPVVCYDSDPYIKYILIESQYGYTKPRRMTDAQVLREMSMDLHRKCQI